MNDLRFYTVIPAHNEEKFIGRCLDSLANQTLPPKKIVVVNDNSSDNTPEIVSSYQKENSVVELVENPSDARHLPGAKVVRAFNKGFETLDENYDVVCKFDADLIFPNDYFETLNREFKSDEKLGLAGGFCYLEKEGDWQLEKHANSDHLRGALKAYRKSCFIAIGGLKTDMGWDTVDEMLVRFNGWKVKTYPDLKVKHLRPTGETYKVSAKYKQGQAFYQMRNGLVITLVSAAKNAWKQSDFSVFKNDIKGYLKAKNAGVKPMVTADEGRFIRRYRWKKMREKLF
jgi:glycosyltransferase involved in cell wall biosynthesis